MLKLEANGFKNYGEQAINGIKVETKEFVKK
jgi:hypothetical protein